MSSLVAGLGDETRFRASALADPTRFRIFRYIARAGHPVTVAELTEFTKLNHNAVRQHLATLMRAELLEGGLQSEGKRGRPKLTYTVAPEAAADAMLSYERLAKALVRAISSGMSPRDAGREEGLKDAIAIQAEAPEMPVLEVLNLAMSAWGFATRIGRDENGADVVTLTSCPLRQAVGLDADVVCSLHLGMVEGALQAAPGCRLLAFEMSESHSGECEFAIAV